MPEDPYAVLHALLRAEAARNAPKPEPTARPAAPDPAAPGNATPRPTAPKASGEHGHP
ncbi:hypothetical protein GCM10010358_41120 [Streptomyces minutiscleroticus]|uniref:Uncharacterized protein n=1 Tax=Streptomyces minutiscleroticus TaxID=68238 RepID=A0A918NN94_9ACTN|nr:hypothetical protein [Streptomyces minutiscleroticus]GGX82674.1 hypothetical protein GCM10010358_41120 [Streptomyces minutiscleroticus]